MSVGRFWDAFQKPWWKRLSLEVCKQSFVQRKMLGICTVALRVCLTPALMQPT